jgi:hypothetical protein
MWPKAVSREAFYYPTAEKPLCRQSQMDSGMAVTQLAMRYPPQWKIPKKYVSGGF